MYKRIERGRVSAYIAASLDGFIARENGTVDWLPSPDETDQSGDYGFSEFFNSVDCLVMGRNTLEKVLEFGAWPYEGKRVLVLSTSISQVPDQVKGKAELYAGSLYALLKLLRSEGCSRIYVDGGKTIQSFLKEGLLTDITITTVPILLGKGIRLFDGNEHDIPLKHLETNSFQSGFVQSSYEIEYA